MVLVKKRTRQSSFALLLAVLFLIVLPSLDDSLVVAQEDNNFLSVCFGLFFDQSLTPLPIPASAFDDLKTGFDADLSTLLNFIPSHSIAVEAHNKTAVCFQTSYTVGDMTGKVYEPLYLAVGENVATFQWPFLTAAVTTATGTTEVAARIFLLSIGHNRHPDFQKLSESAKAGILCIPLVAFVLLVLVRICDSVKTQLETHKIGRPQRLREVLVMIFAATLIIAVAVIYLADEGVVPFPLVTPQRLTAINRCYVEVTGFEPWNKDAVTAGWDEQGAAAFIYGDDSVQIQPRWPCFARAYFNTFHTRYYIDGSTIPLAFQISGASLIVTTPSLDSKSFVDLSITTSSSMLLSNRIYFPNATFRRVEVILNSGIVYADDLTTTDPVQINATSVFLTVLNRTAPHYAKSPPKTVQATVADPELYCLDSQFTTISGGNVVCNTASSIVNDTNAFAGEIGTCQLQVVETPGQLFNSSPQMYSVQSASLYMIQATANPSSKTKGRGFALPPSVSNNILLQLNQSSAWASRFRYPDYVQELNLMTPLLGAMILNTNNPSLVEFFPEVLTWLTAFVLSPAYRRLEIVPSHYQCTAATNAFELVPPRATAFNYVNHRNLRPQDERFVNAVLQPVMEQISTPDTLTTFQLPFEASKEYPVIRRFTFNDGDQELVARPPVADGVLVISVFLASLLALTVLGILIVFRDSWSAFATMKHVHDQIRREIKAILAIQEAQTGKKTEPEKSGLLTFLQAINIEPIVDGLAYQASRRLMMWLRTWYDSSRRTASTSTTHDEFVTLRRFLNMFFKQTETSVDKKDLITLTDFLHHYKVFCLVFGRPHADNITSKGIRESLYFEHDEYATSCLVVRDGLTFLNAEWKMSDFESLDWKRETAQTKGAPPTSKKKEWLDTLLLFDTMFAKCALRAGSSEAVFSYCEREINGKKANPFQSGVLQFIDKNIVRGVEFGIILQVLFRYLILLAPVLITVGSLMSLMMVSIQYEANNSNFRRISDPGSLVPSTFGLGSSVQFIVLVVGYVILAVVVGEHLISCLTSAVARGSLHTVIDVIMAPFRLILLFVVVTSWMFCSSYLFLIGLWWILTSFLAPAVMIPFTSSCLCFVGAVSNVYRNLTSIEKNIKKSIQEWVLEEVTKVFETTVVASSSTGEKSVVQMKKSNPEEQLLKDIPLPIIQFAKEPDYDQKLTAIVALAADTPTKSLVDLFVGAVRSMSMEKLDFGDAVTDLINDVWSVVNTNSSSCATTTNSTTPPPELVNLFHLFVSCLRVGSGPQHYFAVGPLRTALAQYFVYQVSLIESATVTGTTSSSAAVSIDVISLLTRFVETKNLATACNGLFGLLSSIQDIVEADPDSQFSSASSALSSPAYTATLRLCSHLDSFLTPDASSSSSSSSFNPADFRDDIHSFARDVCGIDKEKCETMAETFDKITFSEDDTTAPEACKKKKIETSGALEQKKEDKVEVSSGVSPTERSTKQEQRRESTMSAREMDSMSVSLLGHDHGDALYASHDQLSRQTSLYTPPPARAEEDGDAKRMSDKSDHMIKDAAWQAIHDTFHGNKIWSLASEVQKQCEDLLLRKSIKEHSDQADKLRRRIVAGERWENLRQELFDLPELRHCNKDFLPYTLVSIAPETFANKVGVLSPTAYREQMLRCLTAWIATIGFPTKKDEKQHEWDLSFAAEAFYYRLVYDLIETKKITTSNWESVKHCVELSCPKLVTVLETRLLAGTPTPRSLFEDYWTLVDAPSLDKTITDPQQIVMLVKTKFTPLYLLALNDDALKAIPQTDQQTIGRLFGYTGWTNGVLHECDALFTLAVRGTDAPLAVLNKCSIAVNTVDLRLHPTLGITYAPLFQDVTLETQLAAAVSKTNRLFASIFLAKMATKEEEAKSVPAVEYFASITLERLVSERSLRKVMDQLSTTVRAVLGMNALKDSAKDSSSEQEVAVRRLHVGFRKCSDASQTPKERLVSLLLFLHKFATRPSSSSSPSDSTNSGSDSNNNRNLVHPDSVRSFLSIVMETQSTVSHNNNNNNNNKHADDEGDQGSPANVLLLMLFMAARQPVPLALAKSALKAVTAIFPTWQTAVDSNEPVLQLACQRAAWDHGQVLRDLILPCMATYLGLPSASPVLFGCSDRMLFEVVHALTQPQNKRVAVAVEFARSQLLRQFNAFTLAGSTLGLTRHPCDLWIEDLVDVISKNQARSQRVAPLKSFCKHAGITVPLDSWSGLEKLLDRSASSRDRQAVSVFIKNLFEKLADDGVNLSVEKVKTVLGKVPFFRSVLDALVESVGTTVDEKTLETILNRAKSLAEEQLITRLHLTRTDVILLVLYVAFLFALLIVFLLLGVMAFSDGSVFSSLVGALFPVGGLAGFGNSQDSSSSILETIEEKAKALLHLIVQDAHGEVDNVEKDVEQGEKSHKD